MVSRIFRRLHALWKLSGRLERGVATEQELRRLLEVVLPDGTPNANFFNEKLRDVDLMRLNNKQFGNDLAQRLYDAAQRPRIAGPSSAGLTCKPCTQADLESDAFRWWCQEIRQAPIYHRKIWETCYVLQALHEQGMIAEGRKGLAFAVGKERLPSYLAARGVTVHATDAPPELQSVTGWAETNQHSSSTEAVYCPDLCPREQFDRRVTYEPVDMRAIPAGFAGQFDFCWSICSFEHLGTLRNGLDFVIQALDTLRPGGVAVHTTEFNYAHETKTVDNWSSVLYRKRDFVQLAEEVRALGHEILPLDFQLGTKPMDQFIDLPPFGQPYPDNAHLSLSVDGFACTSYGLILRKRA